MLNKSFVSLVLTLVGNVAFVHAEPTINSVTGVLVDNGTVTINGADFGSQGPSIWLYEDFEGGITGNSVGFNAVIGNWTGTGTYPPVFSDLASYSGNLGMRGYDGTLPNSPCFISGGPNCFQVMKTSFPPATEIFLSYWVQIPLGTTFPGHNTTGLVPTDGSLPVGHIGTSTWKVAWIFDGDNATTNNDVALPTYNNGSFDLEGNNTRQPINNSVRIIAAAALPPQTGLKFAFGQWVRFTAWMKAPPSDPLGLGFARFTYEIPTMGVREIRTNNGEKQVFCGPPIDNNCPSGGTKPPYQWTHLNINAFMGNGVVAPGWAQTHPVFDEVYFATGAGSQARIEICDAQIYVDCERFGFITPNSTLEWTDSSITGVIRKGALTDIDIERGGAYLYVYDENGLVNTTGYPVCGACPKAPENLSVE